MIDTEVEAVGGIRAKVVAVAVAGLMILTRDEDPQTSAVW